jgi:hypothetical protein
MQNPKQVFYAAAIGGTFTLMKQFGVFNWGFSDIVSGFNSNSTTTTTTTTTSTNHSSTTKAPSTTIKN